MGYVLKWLITVTDICCFFKFETQNLNNMEEDKNLEQNLDKSNEKLHISDVSDSTVNFIIWITKNTSSIQSNVRSYKGKMYFMDRRVERGRDNDGGIEDLWKVYIKEIVG